MTNIQQLPESQRENPTLHCQNFNETEYFNNLESWWMKNGDTLAVWYSHSIYKKTGYHVISVVVIVFHVSPLSRSWQNDDDHDDHEDHHTRCVNPECQGMETLNVMGQTLRSIGSVVLQSSLSFTTGWWWRLRQHNNDDDNGSDSRSLSRTRLMHLQSTKHGRCRIKLSVFSLLAFGDGHGRQ